MGRSLSLRGAARPPRPSAADGELTSEGNAEWKVDERGGGGMTALAAVGSSARLSFRGLRRRRPEHIS
eukprot:scaffold743_cov267-Pinguiococcus_pyrenoidosus.AAC.7